MQLTEYSTRTIGIMKSLRSYNFSFKQLLNNSAGNNNMLDTWNIKYVFNEFNVIFSRTFFASFINIIIHTKTL